MARAGTVRRDEGRAVYRVDGRCRHGRLGAGELEPVVMRRILVGLLVLALAVVSAGVGVLVANWPASAQYFWVPR